MVHHHHHKESKFLEQFRQELDRIRDSSNVLPPPPQPGYLYYPGSKEYETSTNDYYWASSKQSPEAVYYPLTPVGIQEFIQQLAHNSGGESIPFAVKAGSHIAPYGFNSTGTRGILVDMILFKDIKYDPILQVMEVGAGTTWVEVQDYISKNRITRNVVGATGCEGVGVAGFLLGGGYGNKANQFGLAMDNIHSIDVVTANGDFLKASPTENPDMYFALMGGGNNFGIVTKWTLKTHAQAQLVWHDTLNYEEKDFPQILTATLAFQEKLDNYRKADCASKFEWTVQDGKLTVAGFAILFYDDFPVPKPVFEEFLKIPVKLEGRSRQYNTFDEIMKNLPRPRQTFRWGVMEGVDDLPDVFRGRYTVVMVSKYTEKLMQRVVDIVRGAAPLLLTHSGLQMYTVISPATTHLFDNSPVAAWPHKKGKVNMMLPIKCLWTDPAEDRFWLLRLREISDLIWQFAISEGCSTPDAPQYYNLSLDSTKVEEIYREHLPRLTELRRRFDRTGLMDNTGGFRIPM